MRIYSELGLDDAERPELDHDTKDTAGWVEITNTILRKIASCAVFVGDVTPVARTADSGKDVPNPNVMAELGYALRAIGDDRIVLVANTAFGATSPEKLPFNMRHRSAPASYKLRKGAADEDIATAKEELIQQLVTRIGNCLKEVQQNKPAATVPWREHKSDDPSLWFEKAATLKHQAFYGSGEILVALADKPRSYMRLLPSGWSSGVPTRDQIRDERLLLPPGRMLSSDGGLTTDGFLSYAVLDDKASPRRTTTLAQFFKDTGEVWGIDTQVIAEHNGVNHLAHAYLIQQWAWFLGLGLKLYSHFGAKAPVHIRVGLTGIEGTVFSGYRRAAIDPSLEYQGELRDFSLNEQRRILTTALNQVREAYGIGTATSMKAELEQIENLLFKSQLASD